MNRKFEKPQAVMQGGDVLLLEQAESEDIGKMKFHTIGSVFLIGAVSTSIFFACGFPTQSKAIGEEVKKPSTTPGNGIFVLCRNLHRRDNWQDVAGSILDLDYVSGLMLYIHWTDFEPRKGDYRWELIETPLRLASQRGKHISFGLLVLVQSPKWLLEESETYTFRHIHPSVGVVTSPVPWCEEYRAALSNVTQLLGKRLDGNSTFNHVVINGPSSLYGVETNFPMARISPEDNNKLGFSYEKYEQGWRESVDCFIRAFPNTNLSLGLHDNVGPRCLNGTSHAADMQVVRAIRDYTIEREKEVNGRKLVIRLLGLNYDNPKYFPSPYTGDPESLSDYVRLVYEVRDKCMIAYEVTRVFRNPNVNANPLDPNQFRRVMENGISHWVNWIEVKELDVWDFQSNRPYEPYAEILKETHELLRQRR